MSLVTHNRWVQVSFLVALSAVGAYIKLGPWAIAFDSMSGFVAALLLGPGAGALVCGLGHMASAAATGFPMTLPFHLVVALTMAGVGAVGGYVARRVSQLAGAVALVLTNGLVAPALLAFLPNPLGTGLFAALAIPLTLAAAANVAVAWPVAAGLRRAGARP